MKTLTIFRPNERFPGFIAMKLYILVTLFIDILGIGIVIPVLPKLVTELLSVESTAEDVISRAGIYLGVIGASYALMQFLFAPV